MSGIGGATPRVLLISLEFPTWRVARGYGYWFNFGLEEGFEANGIEYFTLTVGEHYGERKASWLDHARELCAGQRFDQAWVEIVHSDLDERFLDWLTTVAPVRVAWSPECLVLTPEEWANNPAGCRAREAVLAKRLDYVTHIVTVDEADVDRFNQSGPIPAMWVAGGFVPKRFLLARPTRPAHDVALFYGTLYGERRSWLEDSALARLMVRPSASLEDFTPYPKMFDALQVRTQQLLESRRADLASLSLYLSTLRRIRRECFAWWLETLRLGCAVVNLPQLSNAYAGRVIEGMAAGRPVISWAIRGGSRTEALFEDGREILLYPRDDPAQLAEHIVHIRSDPAFGRRIAANARAKLTSAHTTEQFVRQVFRWASGDAPMAQGLRTGRASGDGEAGVSRDGKAQAGRVAMFVGRARLRTEIAALAARGWLRAHPSALSRLARYGYRLLRWVMRGARYGARWVRPAAAGLRKALRRQNPPGPDGSSAW